MDDRNLSRIVKPTIPASARMTCWLLLACLSLSVMGVGWADEPAWIWTPQKSGIAGIKPHSECYFRKKFTLIRPQRAEITFAAGDEYEIYLNGRIATRGQSFGEQIQVDVSELIEPGVNLLAIKVRHYDSETAGLSLKFRVKEEGDIRWRSLSTDESWKTRTSQVAGWNKNIYNDMAWVKARAFQVAAEQTQPVAPENQLNQETGRVVSKLTPPAGAAKSPAVIRETSPTEAVAIDTAPPSLPTSPSFPATESPTPTTSPSVSSLNPSVQPVNQPTSSNSAPIDTEQTTPLPSGISASATIQAEQADLATKVASRQQPVVPQQPDQQPTIEQRFDIEPGFSVQQIMSDEETGSLIAMEFNEFGQLLLAKENGPLMIADLTKPAYAPGRIRVYCDEVETCQGILPLNGKVYVTANGPQGMGLYLLGDSDNDGKLTIENQLLSFTGKPGEHGPHGIKLGNDGMIYVIIGNGSQIKESIASTSPLNRMIEGDLVPRYEDPTGHAAGVKVPGGTIVRVSLNGQKIERVAGGIRNAYDLAIDQYGEIFIHDSDMESDMGTTWYRPTMLFHVPAGSELGWRSGWAKFAEYFADQTPPVASTGRGSPSGAALYQHLQFPTSYHGSIFLADWSEGRILSFKPEISGAGYSGTPETFLSGRPLNVCDLAVGEDGSLYFCTGGRGTAGGVFQISWNGEIPDQLLNFETDLVKALRHPQPDAAWARQNIAQIRLRMGEDWNRAVQGVALETRNTTALRIRALQLMVLYGPSPDPEMLKTLATDELPEIRAQVARLCGLKPGETRQQIILDLVADQHPYVRRVACESCMRLDIQPTLANLIPMLASLDRIESQTARRMLERMPVETWRSVVLVHSNPRVFIQGAIALSTAYPSLEDSYQVLARSAELMDGFVNDRDFIDLLRTIQIAFVQGGIEPQKIPGMSSRIMDEFPSSSSTINRELARLLGYLKAGDFDGRLVEYLNDEQVSTMDKVHVAMYLINGQQSLTNDERLALVDALETARLTDGVSGGYDQYVQRALDGISGDVVNDDIQTVLDNGDRWPKTTLAAFYKLPRKIDNATEQSVIALDQRLREQKEIDHAGRQVRLGVIAILARDGDQPAMDYLRRIWQEEPDRRNDIVIGLSQQPEGQNWAYLISSLSDLDDLTSQEVLEKLADVPRRPREAKYYRQVIELGYRLRGKGAISAGQLMQHWSGESIGTADQTWEQQLEQWTQWFETKFPGEASINQTTSDKPIGRYSTSQIVDQLEQQGLGDAIRGQAVFQKAQCATCHRIDGVGQTTGPELTNLGSRFSLREVVQSTINPSQVIPDRYASKSILTLEGITITGMAVLQSDGSYSVLQSDGQRIRVAADNIDQIKDHTQSSMPEGLLDPLTMAEISDLLAYMMQSTDNATKTASQDFGNQGQETR